MSSLTAEGTSREVPVGDMTIRVHEAGAGDPVLCIHGGGPGASGWSNFNRNIGPLAERFRMILVDLPGFGGSTKRKFEGPRIAYYASAVRKLMDALDIPKAHFVGNSLGGATSMRLALDSPERAGRLVLMGPAVSISLFTPQPSEGLKHMMGYYRGEPTRERMRAFIGAMVGDPSAVSDRLVDERFAMSVDPDVLASHLGPPSPQSPFEPLWPEAHRISHETLLIWGREDRVIPVDTGLFLMGQMPNARLHVFPNCGHWAQWEKAEEFNPLVSQFLAE